MERLTERTVEGVAIPRMMLRHNGHQRCMDLLAEYEDTEVTPRQIREIDRLYAEKCRELAECRKSQLNGMELANIAMGLKKLRDYEGLEEQGKLLKLPCAVGDTVYEVQELRKRIQPYIVIAVHASNCGNLYGWELKDGKGVYGNVNGFSEYAIGKQVFLTKEEAEAALKELKGQEE